MPAAIFVWSVPPATRSLLLPPLSFVLLVSLMLLVLSLLLGLPAVTTPFLLPPRGVILALAVAVSSFFVSVGVMLALAVAVSSRFVIVGVGLMILAATVAVSSFFV